MKIAPFLLQVVDDVGVVHDLVAHVDRRAEALQRALDDLDGAVDAGAKAARLGEDDFFESWPGAGPRQGRPSPLGGSERRERAQNRIPISCTSKVTGRPASGWLKSKTSASSSTSRTTPAKLAWPSGVGKRTTSPTRYSASASPCSASSARFTRCSSSGLRSPKASPGASANEARAAFFQAEQARFHRRRELAGAERERRRLRAEGIDEGGAVGVAQAIVQGQERPGLDAVQGMEFSGDRLSRFYEPAPSHPCQLTRDAQGHSRLGPPAREAARPRTRRARRCRADRAAAAHRPARHLGAAARAATCSTPSAASAACCAPGPTS